MADVLYDAYFSPDGIKGAIAAVEHQKSIQKWTNSYDASGNASALILTLGDGKNKETGKWEQAWKVLDSKQSRADSDGRFESGSIAVSLNLVELWESVVKRITELEGEGRI